MIVINMAEKKAIKEKFPDIHIVRTMKKDSKRHHYYMAEEIGAMRYLQSLRGESSAKTCSRSRKGV